MYLLFITVKFVPPKSTNAGKKKIKKSKTQLWKRGRRIHLNPNALYMWWRDEEIDITKAWKDISLTKDLHQLYKETHPLTSSSHCWQQSSSVNNFNLHCDQTLHLHHSPPGTSCQSSSLQCVSEEKKKKSARTWITLLLLLLLL